MRMEQTIKIELTEELKESYAEAYIEACNMARRSPKGQVYAEADAEGNVIGFDTVSRWDGTTTILVDDDVCSECLGDTEDLEDEDGDIRNDNRELKIVKDFLFGAGDSECLLKRKIEEYNKDLTLEEYV